MTPMDEYSLWKRTLGDDSDDFKQQREILRQVFLGFRERVAQLVSEIGPLLPDLTVHDITHIDALWRVADEIAGPMYPLNPSEAFVLGGAFLLHDAAHVLAAYEDGLAGIKQTIEWKDLISQRFNHEEPLAGSPQERSALFQALRHLHAKQARNLAKVCWTIPTTQEKIYLLEHQQLREYYGGLIGEIAESHHWDALRVADTFKNRHVSPPSFIAPAKWSVDTLKVAFLLRTADVTHIDSQRAPWFLFALRHPEGISQLHWQFQAKMGQPICTESGEIRLSSGSPFDENNRQAWWLAYDSARQIEKEIRQAQMLLRDANRQPFAAESVENVTSSQAFAINVRTSGWEPIDVGPKIGDIPKVIASLGGAKLYGERPELALRELLQNAADAVRARRITGEIGPKDGEIEVSLISDGDVTWLNVTDNGIGMSRFVLTEVLLDFGNSLWSSDSLRDELPGLASQQFCPVGQFGIGFFSVFMLGSHVVVTTRRFIKSATDNSDQWILEFGNGLDGRPALRRPNGSEGLQHPGTRVSVAIEKKMLQALIVPATKRYFVMLSDIESDYYSPFDRSHNKPDFPGVVASLCPTLDIKVNVHNFHKKSVVINANDWIKLKQTRLVKRLQKGPFSRTDPEEILDLRDNSGNLFGKVGYSYYDSATITFGGINCGYVSSLVGVLLGENNSDLARNKSRPLAPHEAWENWASEWIDKFGKNIISNIVELHPLCPSRVLPLFCMEDKRFTEVQLIKWLENKNEVRVLKDSPTHEDFDDVSVDNFRTYFKPHNDILILPHSGSGNRLAKTLGFVPIDYMDRFEAALKKSWLNFECKEDDDAVCVGEVGGTEIYRLVSRFVRTTEKRISQKARRRGLTKITI